jgi:hypothetical protein
MKIVLTPLDFSNVSDSVLKGAINLARAIEGRFFGQKPPTLNIKNIYFCGQKSA